MKKPILILLLLLGLLSGCAKDASELPSSTTDSVATPDGPQTRTVYVRTSHTLTSGDSVTRTDYLLDEDNQVYQVVIYSDDTETMRYDVECDENGNYVRWIGEHITSTFHYDEQGRPLGKEIYTGELLISSTQYTWDNGNQVGLSDTNGTQEQRTAWFYNEAGQKVREELYQNGVLVNYSQITPTEDGRPLSQDVYLADGTLYSTVHFIYDGLNCTATTTLTDGTLEQRTTYTYDEYGNLLSTTVYNADGELVSQIVDTWMAIEVPADSLRASI